MPNVIAEGLDNLIFIRLITGNCVEINNRVSLGAATKNTPTAASAIGRKWCNFFNFIGGGSGGLTSRAKGRVR